MFNILKKEKLAKDTYLMEIEAPDVAKKAKAGQFIMLRIDEKGERIPLTIADFDKKTITLVFLVVGKTTMQLSKMRKGDNILDFVRKNYQLPGITPKSKVYFLQEKNPNSFAGTSQALVIEEGDKAYLIKENLFELLNHEYEANLLIPRMIEHLNLQGIRVLPIYKTNDGSDYSNIDGHRVEIIDFLDRVRTANLPKMRSRDIINTAQELAKLHLAVKSMDPQIIEGFKRKSDLY